MLSAICFDLDQSKILSSGNELKDLKILIAKKTFRKKVKLLILSNFTFFAMFS